MAVNLIGVEKDSAERGSWLATPGALRESRRIDLRLELLSSAPKISQRTGSMFTMELLKCWLV